MNQVLCTSAMLVTLKTVNMVEKKIAGIRPADIKMKKQVEYKAGSGKFYSLLMGREFKPDQYAIFWDFDNKVETDTKNWLDLVEN